MPAIFWGLASAESKLSCRMLTPDEFDIVANSQKQAADLEIEDKLVCNPQPRPTTFTNQ